MTIPISSFLLCSLRNPELVRAERALGALSGSGKKSCPEVDKSESVVRLRELFLLRIAKSVHIPTSAHRRPEFSTLNGE